MSAIAASKDASFCPIDIYQKLSLCSIPSEGGGASPGPLRASVIPKVDWVSHPHHSGIEYRLGENWVRNGLEFLGSGRLPSRGLTARAALHVCAATKRDARRLTRDVVR